MDTSDPKIFQPILVLVSVGVLVIHKILDILDQTIDEVRKDRIVHPNIRNPENREKNSHKGTKRNSILAIANIEAVSSEGIENIVIVPGNFKNVTDYSFTIKVFFFVCI